MEENKRLYSPSRVKEIMSMFGFKTHKSLGQNFLIDGNIVRRIADAAEIENTDTIIEIGPGIGTLTEELSERAKQVIAIEIDKTLIPILNYTLAARDNITVLNEDALELDVKKIKSDFNIDGKIKVVSNLPYYITTPILTNLIMEEDISLISVLIQKEVAARMGASNSVKEYGSLSVFMTHFSESEMLFTVPSNVFIPKPKVDSAVLRLKIKEDRLEVGEKFFEIVRAAFAMRRKTLLNCLSKSELGYSKEEIISAIEKLEKKEAVRGEELSYLDFVKLSKILN